MQSIQILLVEDNPADADLTMESLTSNRLHLEFTLAQDGVEALEVLYKRGRFALAAVPDLIVLDLNLPRMHGSEFLKIVRSTEGLKRIPVVVLTSSDAEQDVARSYDAGANCYVKKPLDLRAFQDILKVVEQFWFTIVKLPPAPYE